METIAFMLNLLFSVTAAAQKKPLPDSILYAFSSKYQAASDVKYKAKKVDYQIRF
jgi:hypothetical protein